VETNLIVLLLCGVGVYAPDTITDKLYNATVLDLAENGKLAYLISHAAISYGTNYPINRVFITDDFSRVYSTNTIFQLMSRAGRVGKSYIAEAFISDDCASKIINVSETDDIETHNINKLYDVILNENAKLDEALIDNLLNVNITNSSKKSMNFEVILNSPKVEPISNSPKVEPISNSPKVEFSLKDQFSRKSYKNEPSKNEPSKNEPSKNEPSKNEPSKNEPSKNEPSKNEPSKNEFSNNFRFQRERPKIEASSTVTLNSIIDAPPTTSLQNMFKRTTSNQQRRIGGLTIS
jgi:hypothetical protein